MNNPFLLMQRIYNNRRVPPGGRLQSGRMYLQTAGLVRNRSLRIKSARWQIAFFIAAAAEKFYSK